MSLPGLNLWQGSLGVNLAGWSGATESAASEGHSLCGVIISFATGTYDVSRAPQGQYVSGRYAAEDPDMFTITACIQPVNGRDLQPLPEGEYGEEQRVIYTCEELRTRTGTNDPDVITIDGEAWTVIRVERWQAWGGTHYRAYAARKVRP